MQNLINISFISSSLTLVISCLIYVINNFNAKEIEVNLMSNFQKIRYGLSLSLVSAVALSIIIFLKETFEGVEPENTLAIGAFIVTISTMVLLLMLLEIWFIFMAKKRRYVIILNDDSDWEIVKTTNKGLLLKKGEEYKIIDDYFNMPIKRELKGINKKNHDLPNKLDSTS